MGVRLGLFVPVATMLPAAFAQEAPRRGDDIVVEGQKPGKQAERFVDQVIDQRDAQLARFEAPVCVHVAGLAPRVNAAIAERYLTVAQATGVPVAPAGCTPNALILFVDDSETFVQAARKRYRKTFLQLTQTDRRNAFAAGPVRAWRLTVAYDESDREVATAPFGFVDKSGFNPANVGLPTDGPAPPITVSERLRTAAVNTVIVMNRALTFGKSSIQIADYAAMRTLAGARPPRKGALAAPSILSLFDPASTPPREISDMDLALLGGLYARKSLTGNADIELARIARDMTAPAQDPKRKR